ncbi:hypothetical protein KV697_03325 [Sphingomonas sanguinis]|uniref:Uncharacterized protein n=1 Tax=Sphingomonas sanguinis TaxID=33051 RepID=A0ABU5LP60_9SPHN|nr:hypothetical protein [Sphingomonas sanguinis]MDZ7281718.1 hypothetical protein [Sphingomonas sanguinis]QXT36389.1 hypothetical protein KV697_03325 [Sphingomonas sanguinis]
MTIDLVIELLVGFANGLLNAVIICGLAYWLLGRVFGVTEPRLPAILFALGLTLGRFEHAADMVGHPVGRLVGDGLGFVLIRYLWWRRPAAHDDATERAERAGA